MPPVEPITDENTFPDKAGLRPVPTNKNPANYARGVDLNKLKARLKDHAELLNALEELIGEGVEGPPGPQGEPGPPGPQGPPGEPAPGGGTPDAHAASHATGGSDPITPVSIGAATIAEAGNALTAAQNAQTTADDAATAATAAQGTANNAVTAAGTAQTTANAAGMAADTAQDAADAAASAASAAQAAATAAQDTADSALYPLVQSAHTSATKTLAAGDAGDIIPLNAASNAIAVTIPHTLFEAGGTGRAWACGFYVTSVAGGAVTFTGSGGIVIKYFGKKPSATAIVAGDTIFVTVVSATLAHVWISAEIP